MSPATYALAPVRPADLHRTTTPVQSPWHPLDYPYRTVWRDHAASRMTIERPSFRTIWDADDDLFD